MFSFAPAGRIFNDRMTPLQNLWKTLRMRVEWAEVRRHISVDEMGKVGFRIYQLFLLC